MPSTDRRPAVFAAAAAAAAAAAGITTLGALPRDARAQQRAEGFAVERLYLSAPGAGWFVMDDLRLRGGLGGAVSLNAGYARKPLEVSAAGQRLSVVSDQSFAEIGLAVTYDRFRLSMSFAGPLIIIGESGAAGGYQFTAPSANLEQNPDTVSDPRIGLTALVLGDAAGPFRLGAGVQLIVPAGARADYLSDGNYRGMGRLLLAGDGESWTWAGQLGLHVRPRDDGPVPGGPRGSELLFGAAGGARILVGTSPLVVGPEVHGATALKSFLGSQTTGLEALLGASLEGARSDTAGYRLKLGIGAGIDPRFGAPAWRIVAGVELFGRTRGAAESTQGRN